MAGIIKRTFYESLSYKALRSVRLAYDNSRTKKALERLSAYAGESAAGRAYDSFKRQKPTVEHSFYQKAADKLSEYISCIMIKLRGFFEKLVKGSKFCNAYFGFLGNKSINKLRGVCIFGFYFFLTLAAIGLTGIFGAGYASFSFCASIVFLAVALLAEKMAPVFKNSFVVRIISELVK